MNTCRTCRYWEGPRDDPAEFDYCRKIEFDDYKSATNPPANLTDPSTLRTRADFGCTLHEPIEGADEPKGGIIVHADVLERLRASTDPATIEFIKDLHITVMP